MPIVAKGKQDREVADDEDGERARNCTPSTVRPMKACLSSAKKSIPSCHERNNTVTVRSGPTVCSSVDKKATSNSLIIKSIYKTLPLWRTEVATLRPRMAYYRFPARVIARTYTLSDTSRVGDSTAGVSPAVAAAAATVIANVVIPVR